MVVMTPWLGAFREVDHKAGGQPSLAAEAGSYYYTLNYNELSRYKQAYSPWSFAKLNLFTLIYYTY